MNDKELLKKHFKLLMQAKEAGYISDEERSMMCEFARRGSVMEAEKKKLSQLRLELDDMTRQRDIALEWVDQP